MEVISGGFISFCFQILNNYFQFEVFYGFFDVEFVMLFRLWVIDGEWYYLFIELKNVKEDSEMKYLVIMILDYGMDQNRVDIGGMFFGLIIRSVVVGGVFEDKVFVYYGF